MSSRKRFTERELLEGLDEVSTHADEFASLRDCEMGADLLRTIFAYRVICMRDRFPQPFRSFREALEALQGEEAYLPEMAGEITAYLEDGRSITVPEKFFIRYQPRFETQELAEAWVRKRMKDISEGDPSARIFDIGLANPSDPVDKQIENALAHRDPMLASPDMNDEICVAVECCYPTHWKASIEEARRLQELSATRLLN